MYMNVCVHMCMYIDGLIVHMHRFVRVRTCVSARGWSCSDLYLCFLIVRRKRTFAGRQKRVAALAHVGCRRAWGQNGLTALMLANNAETVQALIAGGAEVEARDVVCGCRVDVSHRVSVDTHYVHVCVDMSA